MKNTAGSRKKGWAIAAVALAVILGLGVTLGIATRWGKPWQSDDKTSVGTQGGGMIVGDEEGGEGDGIALVARVIGAEDYASHGISPAAMTAIEVKAVITPSEAENNRLDWSLTWKSGTDGSWGEGKEVTEYVNGIVSQDTHTYTISCMQAFGEKIVLRAGIRGNPKIYKTKEVDFLQGYRDISARVSHSGSAQKEADLEWNIFGESCEVKFAGFPKTTQTFKDYYAEGGSGTTTVCVTAGLSEVYTVAAEVTDVKAEVCVTQEYVEAVTSAFGTTDNVAETYITLGTGNGQGAEFTTSIAKILFLTEAGELEYAPFKYNLSQITSKPLLKMKLTATVNGHEHTEEIGIRFDPSSFGTFASGLEWENEDPILFSQE